MDVAVRMKASGQFPTLVTMWGKRMLVPEIARLERGGSTSTPATWPHPDHGIGGHFAARGAVRKGVGYRCARGNRGARGCTGEKHFSGCTADRHFSGCTAGTRFSGSAEEERHDGDPTHPGGDSPNPKVRGGLPEPTTEVSTEIHDQWLVDLGPNPEESTGGWSEGAGEIGVQVVAGVREGPGRRVLGR